MKPIHLVCAFLALSASHLFAADPSRAFLAPATTTGEEAAGFIPVAAVDQSVPASEKSSETKGGTGAMQASLSFTSVRDRKEDRKTKVVTITQNEVLGVRIAGLPAFLHKETYDDKGLLTKSDSLLPRGNPNFYSATFQSPGVNIQIDRKQAARFMYSRYLGGAVASGDDAAKGMLVFDVWDKPGSTVRLVIRMVSGKDGWQRWMFTTDEGLRFERVPFGHRPEKDAISGREESLWLMGQTDDERKDSGQAKSIPLDANLPGAVWYGSGKKGANLAGYAVFSPATAATAKAGNWSKGELSVVSLASQDADLRVMLKESKNFGEPEAELAAFAKELPKLSQDLDLTSFALPLDAEGLGLDAAKRAFIERLLASAPALEATSAEAKAVADTLRAALENYDRAMSTLKAAKTDSERMKAEVPAVLARAVIEDNIAPLAKIWADAGGVESPAGTTAATPTAVTTIPPDARYSTEAPSCGLETTKWLGEKSPGKKLSVLVLYGGIDFWEQHGRKLVELKRALNLDMEYAMAYQSDTMSSRVDEQRIRQLLASRRWDVILDWNVQSMHGPSDNINILPPDIRAAIYRAVMDEGTGLLLLSGKTAPEFLKADRLQPSAGQKTFAGLTLTGRVPRQSKVDGKVTPLEAEQKIADTYFGLYKAGRGLALAVDPRMGQSVSVSSTPGTLYISEMVPWGPRNKVDGDYFHAEMARMLLMAAGREPDVTFTKAPPLLNAAPGTTSSLRESWSVRCKDGVKGLKATVRLRGLDGKVISEKTQEVALKNGEGEIPLTLPELGAGTYYADLFLDSARGRENFGYAAVLVPDVAKTSLRLEPALSATTSESKPLVEYWSEAIKPGDPITGSVTVTNPPDGNAAKQVRISLVDEFDRVLASQTSDLPANGVLSFSLPTKDIDRIPLRVEAQSVGADGCVLGDDMAEFCLRQTNRDRFQVSLSGSSTDPWWLWTHRSIWQQGCTMLPVGFTAARANMGASLFSGMGTLRGTFRGQAYGVPALPGAQPTKPGIPLSMTMLYRMGWDEATGVRNLPPAPWNDPQAFEEVLDLTQHVWDKTCRFPAPVSVLYDEGSNICADTSAPGMKAWQEWLRAEYKGDIAALNREWNSQFAKFEEITQTTGQMKKELRGDPFESAALTDGNYARWMDRRIFANQNYANLILDGYTQRARKTDPDARIGLSGTFGFHNFGMDYDVWLKKSGFWTPYAAPRGGDGLVMDLIRSNRPEDYMYSYWIGYNNGTQLPLIWDMVFKGANAVWWFQMSGDGTYGWLGRNDVPYAVRQTMIDQAILPLRRGLGDLLIRLKALSDPIAVYYSPQVALASGTQFIPEMKGPGIGNEFAGAGSSAAGAIDLIRDSQREFLYLTKKRVLDGDLKKLGTKLLFLPMAQPLGEEDVAALRAFAEAGCIVVADLRPGVLSARGRPVVESPVDKLFGIKRTGPGKAQEINFSGPVQVGGRSVNLTLNKAKADAEIAADGASVGATADGVPLVLFNKVGQGGFCLLNFGFDRYAAARKDAAAGTGWRDLFAALGTVATLPPPMADVKDKTGANPLCRLNVWEKGGLKLYGMLGGDGSGSITLPQPSWLFDLRRGPLGKTDKALIDLFAADTPQFIAAYAFDPGDPVVKSSAAGAKAGESVRFDLSMAGAPSGDETTFSYHTRLLNPKGEWVDVIPWSAQGAAGKASVVWRVAENDLKGQWTLEVREITTGRTAKATINKE
jgi:hypothetical protein